jgi:hypothetical protein
MGATTVNPSSKSNFPSSPLPEQQQPRKLLQKRIFRGRQLRGLGESRVVELFHFSANDASFQFRGATNQKQLGKARENFFICQLLSCCYRTNPFSNNCKTWCCCCCWANNTLLGFETNLFKKMQF